MSLPIFMGKKKKLTHVFDIKILVGTYLWHTMKKEEERLGTWY